MSWRSALEVTLLVLLFYWFSPGGVPGVNEPHYLCKAKNFWNAEFCKGDFFLESANAHYVFYFTLGLLTKYFSLHNSAVIGRLICWVAIALGWRILCHAIFGTHFWSVLAAGVSLLGLNYCHFAGEWLIGGAEAKCIAYGLLFAGLGYLVQQKWYPVWILFGISAAFHVLIGGWGVIAGLTSLIYCRAWRIGRKRLAMSLLTGFLFSLLGLLPALAMTLGQDSMVMKNANEIYTFERIAHHLVFSHIYQGNPARLILFITATLIWLTLVWTCWSNRQYRVLSSFILGTLIIACLAPAIEYYALSSGNLPLAANLLRFYWFRLSDVMVPTGVGIGMALLCRTFLVIRYEFGAVMISIFSCLLVGHVIWNGVHHAISKRSQADELTLVSFDQQIDLNRKLVRDWIDACVWIRNRTEPNARFITPRSQSTFKWYAHRSEVVSWKDVPQDPLGIVEWKRRFERVFDRHTFRLGHATLDAERNLLQLSKEFNAQYLVIERRHVRQRKADLEFRFRYQQYCLGNSDAKHPFQKPLCLQQVYPDKSCSAETQKESSYLVYQIKIPKNYESQVAELDAMLSWYEKLDQELLSQQTIRNDKDRMLKTKAVDDQQK
ncbi:MAG: DUF6798 domain-containing protein [Planctomycetota bacterium]|nr:DUF6798 domain-containing protein [Planctomycetota bacterium]